MKKLLLILFSYYTGPVCFSQSSAIEYKIDGRIEGLYSGKIYFAAMYPLKVRDSAEIRNERFRFTGILPEPSRVIVYIKNNSTKSSRDNKYSFTFFLDKGLHTILLNNKDLSKGKVKGSAAAHDYEVLKAIENSILGRLNSIEHLNKDTSEPAMKADMKKETYEMIKSNTKEYEKAAASIMADLKAVQLAFIKSYPSTAAALWAAHYNFLNSPSLEEVYNALSPSLLTTRYGLSMKERIKKNKMLSIGNIAPDFTQNDTLGKPVSLSDFRRKYVLIDFWASWCGPCRLENPNIVRAYNTFKDKGFTVLGVSLEHPGERQAWLNAIHMDGLTWTHVSDMKGWNTELVKQYGVSKVPTNWLIGPDGKILAKDLYGDQLQNILQNILQ